MFAVNWELRLTRISASLSTVSDCLLCVYPSNAFNAMGTSFLRLLPVIWFDVDVVNGPVTSARIAVEAGPCLAWWFSFLDLVASFSSANAI